MTAAPALECVNLSAGYDKLVVVRSIDLAVSRLRAKLRESLENPQFIRTVRGRGYQFTAELAR